MVVSLGIAYSLVKPSDEIDIFEAKLKRISNAIKEESCDKDAVAALFVEATHLLEGLKKLYFVINNKDDNTTAQVKITENKDKLKKIISEIEEHYKQCSNTRKQYPTAGETSFSNQMSVKRIGVEQEVSPRYNYPAETTDNEKQDHLS